MYISGVSSVGKVDDPDGRCTPILLAVSLFQVVLGGTYVVYEVSRGRESMSGSFLVSYMEQVVGMFSLGRRGEEMGDGGSIMYIVLRI